MAEVLEIEARLIDNFSKQVKNIEGRLRNMGQKGKKAFGDANRQAVMFSRGMFRVVKPLNDAQKKAAILNERLRITKSRMRATSSFTQKMGKSLAMAGLRMAGMIVSVTLFTRLIRTMATGIFNAGSAVEQFAINLQAVEGSAEAADKQLKKIRKFAAESPLETQDVVEAFVKLRAVGIPATFEVTKALGNVGLVFSKSLEEVSTAFISLNRRVLRRFGVVVDRTGRKAVISMKGIRKEVEKNDIEIRKGLLAAWQEKYPNALELAGSTTKARLAVMRSQFFELGAAIGTRVNKAIKGMADGVGEVAKALRGVLAPETLTLEEQLIAVNIQIADQGKLFNKNVRTAAGLAKSAISAGRSQIETERELAREREANGDDLKEFMAEAEKQFNRRKNQTLAETNLEQVRNGTINDTRENLLLLTKQLIERRLKEISLAGEETGVEERRLTLLDKVAIFRSELASKSIKARIEQLEREKEIILKEAQAVKLGKEEQLVIIQRFNALIAEEEGRLVAERLKESKEMQKRSQEVIKAFKETQKKLTEAQAEEFKKRVEQNRQELREFMDNQERLGQFMEAFAINIGSALASGIEEGTKGLKTSLKNVLLVVVSFLQKLWLASIAGAGLQAVLGNPTALIKLALGTAAFEAAKGAIRSFGQGGQFMTNGPEFIQVGDNPGGRELVTVQPMNNSSINLRGGDINVAGNVTPDAIPGIQAAQAMSNAAMVRQLEDISRRGQAEPDKLRGLTG